MDDQFKSSALPDPTSNHPTDDTNSESSPPLAGNSISPSANPTDVPAAPASSSVENTVSEAVSTEPEPTPVTPESANAEQTSSTPTANTPSGDHNPMAIPSKQHKGGKPVMVIVLAVIVALALAGLVVFMYLKTKAKPAPSTQSSAATVVSKPQASPSDVDSANQQIDTSLNKTDDTKDFAPADMSDATLGL